MEVGKMEVVRMRREMENIGTFSQETGPIHKFEPFFEDSESFEKWRAEADQRLDGWFDTFFERASVRREIEIIEERDIYPVVDTGLILDLIKGLPYQDKRRIRKVMADIDATGGHIRYFLIYLQGMVKKGVVE